MADYLDNYADIVFLDSELEDDDDNAPVGELIEVVDGKVRIAEKKEHAPQTAESAPEEKEEAPSPATPDETPVVQQLPVFPAAVAEEQPEAKDGESAAQENADAADELPLAVDLLLGLVRRGVAVLDHVRQEAQHEPSRVLLSAARDLDHVE